MGMSQNKGLYAEKNRTTSMPQSETAWSNLSKGPKPVLIQVCLNFIEVCLLSFVLASCIREKSVPDVIDVLQVLHYAKFQRSFEDLWILTYFNILVKPRHKSTTLGWPVGIRWIRWALDSSCLPNRPRRSPGSRTQCHELRSADHELLAPPRHISSKKKWDSETY